MNDVLDPFDPASLRLDQTFTDGTAVKKLITTIPVRKPSRQDFVRVHSDPAYRLSPAAIIELKDDREVYLGDTGHRSRPRGRVGCCHHLHDN
jgi:hypothetical protein